MFAGIRADADGDDLVRHASERLTPVTLDVTKQHTIETTARQINDHVEGAGLHGLVNNAGIVVAGPLEVLPLDDFRLQFEVNVFGLLAVTQQMLPLLRRSHGRVVNVGSINGKVVSPFTAAYGASKFALEAMTDGLRMELSHWNIPVSLLQPGAIATPIWEASKGRALEIATRLPDGANELYGGVIRRMRERAGAPPKHAIPPERVAEVVHRALTAARPKTRYVVGRDARIALVLRRLLPDRWLDKILIRRRNEGRSKTAQDGRRRSSDAGRRR